MEENSAIATLVAKKVFSRFAGGIKFEYDALEIDDPLDAQIEMNCDSLINKLLHYLSQLPIQLSFKKMQPKLG